MGIRAYLRLDPTFPDHKLDYPDGAFRALVEVFCFAEQQPVRGTFRNERLLKALLGKRSRWIPYLRSHGDLVELERGAIYVDGWHEWQEGDWQVAERMRRVRSRKHNDVDRNEGDGADRNESNGSTVTRPSSRGGGGRAVAESKNGARANGGKPNGADPDQFALQQLAEELTGVPFVLQNLRQALGQRALRQLRAHGLIRVQEAWRDAAAAAGPYPELGQIVLGAANELNPVPSGRSTKERANDEREDVLRRVREGSFNGRQA